MPSQVLSKQEVIVVVIVIACSSSSHFPLSVVPSATKNKREHEPTSGTTSEGRFAHYMYTVHYTDLKKLIMDLTEQKYTTSCASRMSCPDHSLPLLQMEGPTCPQHEKIVAGPQPSDRGCEPTSSGWPGGHTPCRGPG